MQNIAVFGLGKVGHLVAQLLHDGGFIVTGLDVQAPENKPYNVLSIDVSDADKLTEILQNQDAVVSCLPYHLNKRLAKAAYDVGIHYFDLTEDVATTQYIRELAKDSKGLMAPQCGLAPGFIGIVGADLAKKFNELRSIELRVGALPQHPRGKLGYAFNWSPEGVVNEYLNACEVIENGEHKFVPALEKLETIYIEGMKLESFTTSGGLGTMCETYTDKVETLNYKTMRYPGHCDLMRFFFNELRMKNRREVAGDILTNAKPPVNDDVVYVHAAVEGKVDGKLMREEFVRGYFPLEINGEMERAISWTTAASLVSVVELVKLDVLPQKGFLKQEEIPLDKFLKTKTGSFYEK